MTSINYGPYTPTQLKVVSLGIGISDETNNTLNILNNQSLIVGERIQDNFGQCNQKTYGLIVDTQGIAINTSMNNRSLPYNNYAAYIDGDIRVTGNIFLDGSITCNLGLLNGTMSNNYWNMAPDGTYNNIYYGENITIGNKTAAMSNTFSVNIFQSADTNIEQSQLSIQNLQASQLRMGVIGTAYNSPIIFNTNSFSTAGGISSPSGGSIEFHMGRDQNYFSNIYFAEDGSTTGLPNYTSSQPPHFQIDYAGNVGINTSVNTPVSFKLRSVNAGGVVSFTPITTPMSLNVQGSTYSENMLIYDYESAAMCNIDSLYVRRLGVAFEANQIIPGTFANGNDYTFPNSLNVNKNINVYGTGNFNNLVANNSIIDNASFCNDTLFNRDIIVNQSLRLRGQIFTEVFTGLSQDGSSNYGFEMIQFTPANVSYSNINVIGTGIATPGRLGVGIDPSADANNPVNTQFAIYKTDPKIWEISMFDKSDTYTNTIKAGYIGHPYVSPNFNGGLDASLVIATPSYNDPDYAGNYEALVQNIYFFPGIDMSSISSHIVSGAVPPTLGIFNQPANITNAAIRAVGVNTYNPLSEFDVNGSITFSGNMYYNPNRTKNGNIQLAIWKTEVYNANLTPDAPGLFYTGISYIAENPNAAHVGINTTPDYLYGLIVSGNTKFINDIYTADTYNIDRAVGFWQDNRDHITTSNNFAPATQQLAGGLITWANAGIGVLYPKVNLEIKDNYDIGSTLQLTRGYGDSSNASLSSLIYQGNEPYNSWTFQADHIHKYFQIGNGDIPFNNPNTERYMWMRPTPFTNKPQIVLGGNLNIHNSSSNPDRNALLTVGGNMSVLGNVSISGQFIINGKTLINSNIPGSTETPLNNDDVFIGGGNIQFSPGTDFQNNIQSVVIGTPFATYSGPNGPVPILGNQPNITDPDVNKMLRVYNKNEGVVASFQGTGKTSLIEIVRNYGINNSSKDILQFGIFDSSINSPYNGTTFAFMDGSTQKPYLSFQTLGTNADKYVGIGIPFSQTPTAITHLYTEGTGNNMLRLTRGVFSLNDSTDGAPQIDFQKNYQTSSNNLASILQAPKSWTFKGPCGWNEKMSFIYNEPTYSGSFITQSTEVFTIANNGCLGINNSQPTFSLDIINNGNTGSLRLLNTGTNASPQIIFQSGNIEDVYGSDSLRDFRMAASNSTFTFDSKDRNIHYFILDVDQNNHIGIGQAANCNFDVSINGIVNIGQGLYLNGNPLFSTGNLIQNGVTINGNNIFITPNVGYPTPNGGVVINGTLPTGNLFDIQSGNNPNMMVLDSSYPQAQMHIRTSNNGIHNMYRISMSNTSYLWQYYPNCYDSLTINPNDNGYQQVMHVQPTLRLVPQQSLPEFDFTVDGSIILNSSNNPGLYFGTPHTNSSMGYISGSNANICLIPSSSQHGVGIGTYNAQSNFHVVGTSLFDGYTTFNYNTNLNANLYVYGNSYVQGNQITGLMTTNSSDKRLKKDLIKIDNALTKINTLTGYTYSLINDDTNINRRYTGLVAQEVESVLPEAILKYTPSNLLDTPSNLLDTPSNLLDAPSNNENQYLSISYGNMMGLVVEAIKDLTLQIAEIKSHLKMN